MEESEDKKIDLKEEFPGIEFAFPIAMDAYKISRERFDLMEKRGQTLIVFITTIGLAIVTLTSRQTPAPRVSFALVLAVLLYICSLLCALGSQVAGKVIVSDPRLLREKTLTWDEWTFKNNLIDWAGKHYANNLEVIQWRSTLVTGTLLFGIVTLFSLALWAS